MRLHSMRRALLGPAGGGGLACPCAGEGVLRSMEGAGHFLKEPQLPAQSRWGLIPAAVGHFLPLLTCGF